MSQSTQTPRVITLAERGPEPSRSLNLEMLPPLAADTDPESAAAQLRQAAVLAVILDAATVTDLPRVAHWTVDSYSASKYGCRPIIRGMLSGRGGEQTVRRSVALWASALDGEVQEEPHPTLHILAAVAEVSGQLVAVWDSWPRNDEDTDASDRSAPMAPLAGAAASVAPVEQLLQEV